MSRRRGGKSVCSFERKQVRRKEREFGWCLQVLFFNFVFSVLIFDYYIALCLSKVKVSMVR